MKFRELMRRKLFGIPYPVLAIGAALLLVWWWRARANAPLDEAAEEEGAGGSPFVPFPVGGGGGGDFEPPPSPPGEPGPGDCPEGQHWVFINGHWECRECPSGWHWDGSKCVKDPGKKKPHAHRHKHPLYGHKGHPKKVCKSHPHPTGPAHHPRIPKC